MPSFEEYIEGIRVLWGSHWLTNMGTKHKQLEVELSRYLNTSNITLFTNWHLEELGKTFIPNLSKRMKMFLLHIVQKKTILY